MTKELQISTSIMCNISNTNQYNRNINKSRKLFKT